MGSMWCLKTFFPCKLARLMGGDWSRLASRRCQL